MAVSPLRALAVAHLQGTWNRLRRHSGVLGVWAFAVALLLVGVLVIVPGLAMAAGFGYLFGRALTSGDATLAVELASLAITGLAVVLGGVGGVTGGARQLPWETLQVFPVSGLTLFCVDVLASALEVTSLLVLGAMAVGVAGACVAAPAASPMLLWVLATHAVVLLVMQQLVGSIAQRVSRDFKGVAVVLGLVAMTLPLLLMGELPEQGESRATMERWSLALEAWTVWLPARWALEAARAMAGGAWTWGAVARGALGCLAFAGGLFVAAWQTVARERPGAVAAQGERLARLWSFRSPVLGIARLQWVTLMRSLPGRAGLVMPLVAVVLLQGPLWVLRDAMSLGAWSVPGAYAYVAVAGTNLLFNQFGLDRHGVKALFLLPVEARVLLTGKLLGLMAWHALQALVLTVLLAVVLHPPWVALAGGVLQYACTFLLLSMAGQFYSVWEPRPLKRNGLRASQPGLIEALLMFGSLGGALGLVGAARLATRTVAPAWEVPALVLLTLALAALTRPITELNALLLVRRRELVLEILASSG